MENIGEAMFLKCRKKNSSNILCILKIKSFKNKCKVKHFSNKETQGRIQAYKRPLQEILSKVLQAEMKWSQIKSQIFKDKWRELDTVTPR